MDRVIELTRHIDELFRHRQVTRPSATREFGDNTELAQRTVRGEIKPAQLVSSQICNDHVLTIGRNRRTVGMRAALAVLIGPTALMIVDGEAHFSLFVPGR